MSEAYKCDGCFNLFKGEPPGIVTTRKLGLQTTVYQFCWVCFSSVGVAIAGLYPDDVLDFVPSLDDAEAVAANIVRQGAAQAQNQLIRDMTGEKGGE